jgi:hypothetical protein
VRLLADGDEHRRLLQRWPHVNVDQRCAENDFSASQASSLRYGLPMQQCAALQPHAHCLLVSAAQLQAAAVLMHPALQLTLACSGSGRHEATEHINTGEQEGRKAGSTTVSGFARHAVHHTFAVVAVTA